MRNVIMYKKGEQSWVRWIKKRIKNNLNFMTIFEGPTGVGKSWSALSIAYDIDNEFNPREQVAFSFKDVMRIINRFNDVNDIMNKRKYKVLMFDEAQTTLSNRDWQSRVNKLFNFLVSTFRHQQIILLFTSPYSDFLDSASMKLLHAKFECKGWDKKTKISRLRPKLLQYNSKMKKFYEHSLFVIKNKRMNKLVDWYVHAPPEHLVTPYEEMKTNFTQELNKKITEELEGMDKKEKAAGHRKPLTEKQRQVMELLANNSYKKAIKVLGISTTTLYDYRAAAEKKGYYLEEFKQNVN